MKALAKDPRQRQQSMEELFDELQRCYGSVRYRRSLEVRSAPESPIPLQRVKRPGSGPFSEPIARVTPPEFQRRGHRPGQRPDPAHPSQGTAQDAADGAPACVTPPPSARRRHDEPRRVTNAGGDWVDMDVDAPDGTGG